MRAYQQTATAMGPAVALALVVFTPAESRQLAMSPNRNAGDAVTGAFEGWYKEQDGSTRFLVGYFNRNLKQVIDIPIGPNNRIDPGGPDMGQPTHFLPRRQWGVFTIAVPKDFGDKQLTWTLVANGQTTQIPLKLHPNYQVEPFEEKGMGNTPPAIRFDPGGSIHAGPPNGVTAAYEAAVGQPLTLTLWITDKPGRPQAGDPRAGGTGPGASGRGAARPEATVKWVLHRGPGEVTFKDASPPIDTTAGGKASTTATFSAPGEYVLRAQANDTTGDGGGGFQCCWSNALVKVTVGERRD